MRLAFLLGTLAAALALSASAWGGVSGAAFTTVNTTVDGTGHCKNGNPPINCNMYDGKQYVWLNGGPSVNGLGPNGQYFFVVLAPGGQPNPNDGGPKNLSDDYDTYANRTFTITNGEVSAYAGSHDKAIPLIRLYPYADTTNPGGVYIMAICSSGYPVAPSSCKYDAFKVQKTGTKIQSVLDGRKYLDANGNGQPDPGEVGIANWKVHLTGNDGTNVTVATDANGEWSFSTPAHPAQSGTTLYQVSEVGQNGWDQTGNTVDQTIETGGAWGSLSNFSWTVSIPNDHVSAVEMLDFGNRPDQPPVCTGPVFSADGSSFTVTVQDSDTGLGSITTTSLTNGTLTINPNPFSGLTTPVVLTVNRITAGQNYGLAIRVTDLKGNYTDCDPLVGIVGRTLHRFSGLTRDDRIVTVRNGTARTVTVNVNGKTFVVSNLRKGETRRIDVGRALLPGRRNVVTAIARGGLHPSVLLAFSN